MTRQKYFQRLIIPLLILAISSCQNPAEADRVFNVFLIGMLQVMNMVVFGVSALIFTLLGYSGRKQGLRITGAILGSLFTLITLLSFLGLQEFHPRHYFIFTIFLIELIMIAIWAIYSFRRFPTATSDRKSINSQTLDEIIAEEEIT